MQNNLASRYEEVGKTEYAIGTRQEVYSGFLRLKGEHHEWTLTSAICYASTLMNLQRYGEAKALMRKLTPVARRSLGDSHGITLQMRWNYARALCYDPSATLADLREAITKLEDLAPTARRLLGGTHPHTTGIQTTLRNAREALRAREPGTS